MDDATNEIRRAAQHIHTPWNDLRTERSLAAAKRRRVKRSVGKAALVTVAAAVLAFAFLQDSPGPEVAQPVEVQPRTVEKVAPEPRQLALPERPEPAGASGEDAPKPAWAESTVKEAKKARRKPSAPGKRADAETTTTRVQSAAAAFRRKMAEGDASGAYAILLRERPVLTSLDDLMLAADAARRAGNAQRAVDFLEEGLARHRTERSAVAAYTLGKLLMADLHRPHDAARAFALVRARSPNAPLAADALAHEARSLEAAGQHVQAKKQAALYLARYPEGERRAWMERITERP